MDKIYVFGHKKPDTDSVTSAIALAYLKRQLGQNAEARVLGRINNETKYALDYFGVEEPPFLNDVKVQLQDVNYHKGLFLKETASIYDGYNMMSEKEVTGLPVVNEKNRFQGLITIKDLAKFFIGGNMTSLCTSYDNILRGLEGEEILRFQDEIEGQLKVASYRSTTFLETISLLKDDILIVGDRHSIIEYAVNSKIQLLVVVGNGEIKQEHLEIAKQNKVNIIRTHYDTLHTAKLIFVTNYLKTILGSARIISFDQTDYFDDFVEVTNKLKHTNYPVLNKRKECLGLLRTSDLTEKKRKQVILVDHSEKSQSVDGLEEAEVLEVVDHHNLGTLTTSNPVSIRCMTVGCTGTIIYQLYLENGIEIPKEIAGLLLSGILSDTLLFKSPTTTSLDQETALKLARIAEVDPSSYGLSMLKAGTSIEGKTKEDILYTDFKVYPMNEKQIGIGQFFTFHFEEMKKDLNEYVETLNNVAENNNYDCVILFVTDILKNGSYVIYSDKAKNLLEQAYLVEKLEEGYYLPGVVSRKKQVVPYLSEVLDGR